MKQKITAAAVALVTLSTTLTAFAGAGKRNSSGVGGGGTAVILPDDTVVLTDPYVSQDGLPTDGQLGTLVQLSAPVIEELTRAGEMISRYAGLTPDVYDSKNPFLLENVLGPTTQYRMVTQIPEICPYRAPNLNGIPANSQVTEIACTKGQYTFIKGDLFRRMTVREQAKLIIHERLRATSLSSDLLADRVIADITTGVGTVLSLYNSLLQGLRPIPTEQEYSHLQTMVKTLALHWDAFDSHPGFQVQVLRNGGGLVVKPSGENPPGYVGAGSAVLFSTQMAADSEIVGFGSTCVFGNCALEKGAKITFPSMGTSYFGGHASIHLGENAELL